jgi:predicted component of type VI protein secretion system
MADPGLLDDLPVVDLEFITGSGESHSDQAWRIAEAVSLVGASRHCDLWLRDESVSNVHASLVLTPRGLWVVDLLGRGSVLVNGRPAYWKQIHDGSRLQIGRYRFRVQFEDPGRATSRPGHARAPEIVATADRPLAPGQIAPGGGLSEQSVMALIGQMAEMQNRFFEHSQNQMQFMAEMLAHMGRSQQAAVRQDMARIEEITRELEALKAQLAAEPAQGAPRRKRKKDAARRRRIREATAIPPVETFPPAVAAALDPETSGANPEPATRPPSAPPREPLVRNPVDHQTTEDEPRPATSGGVEGDPNRTFAEPTDAHARLTERMARLARERNAGWRRILAAFTRKPTGE